MIDNAFPKLKDLHEYAPRLSPDAQAWMQTKCDDQPYEELTISTLEVDTGT